MKTTARHSSFANYLALAQERPPAEDPLCQVDLSVADKKAFRSLSTPVLAICDCVDVPMIWAWLAVTHYGAREWINADGWTINDRIRYWIDPGTEATRKFTPTPRWNGAIPREFWSSALDHTVD